MMFFLWNIILRENIMENLDFIIVGEEVLFLPYFYCRGLLCVIFLMRSTLNYSSNQDEIYEKTFSSTDSVWQDRENGAWA